MLVTHTGGRQCVGWVISVVGDFVCASVSFSAQEKRPELSTLNMVQSMAATSRVRKVGQRSKVKVTRTSNALPAWVWRSMSVSAWLRSTVWQQLTKCQPITRILNLQTHHLSYICVLGVYCMYTVAFVNGKINGGSRSSDSTWYSCSRVLTATGFVNK